MKILVCGNPLIKKDTAALKIAEKLKKILPEIEFEEFDSVEELKDKNIFILDVVQDLKKPEVIKDLDRIVTKKIYSMHDFDLGQSLKLMKKLGIIEKVTIFGVPEKSGTKTVAQLVELIKSNLPSRSE